MSQRSNTIKAAGLYTFLSELQAPEGSLVKADNVNIDEMGVITPRRGFGDYGKELSDTTQTVKQLLEYKNRILRHYNGKLEFDDGNGVFTPFLETIEEVEPGLRIKSKQVNSNLYFTTNDGIKKLSASKQSDLSNINIDNAGVPKAVDISAKVSPSTIGFLPPRSKVGYKILYGYKDLNNVLILGAPTSVFVVTNSEEESVIPEQFSITFQDNFTGSDFIEGLNNVSGGSGGTGKYFTLSTKDIDYYIWYSISDLVDGLETENPENLETFGKVAIKVSIKEDDTEDKIAAKTANVLNSELSSQYEITFVENAITLKSKEKGDIVDARIGNLVSNQIIIENINQGNLTLGKQVDCEISTIIPKSIDKNKLPYFIQIYRTKVITATEDQQLSDISPGEECNLVHEEAVQLEPGEIYTHIDDITEDFRDRGTPLYNNPFSGEGLLQTNEVPPIAKDIENFNNYTFYANTKTFHRSQFRFVSVDDFKNEQTSIYIGNKDTFRKYTFEGTQQQTQIKCGTKADTLEAVIEENELKFKDSSIDYLVDTAEFQDAVDNGIEPVINDSLAIFENYLADSPSLITLNFYEIVNNQLMLKDNSIENIHEEIRSIDIYQNYLATLSQDIFNFSDGVLRLYEIIKDPVTENITLTQIGSSTFNSSSLSNNSALSIFNDTVVYTDDGGDNIFIHKIQNNTINSTPDLIIDNQTITNLKVSSLNLYENLLLIGGEKTILIDISDLQNIIIKNEISTLMQESYVSIQGSYALVSNVLSSGSNESFTNSGEVKVYKINTDNQLNLLTTLYSPIEINSGSFGRSVDIYNNYITIGQKKRTSPFGEGNLFLFRINNDDSIELVNIQSSSDESQTNSFGEMVRLYDNKIAVGTTGSVGAPGTHLFEIQQQTEYSPVESTKQSPAFLELYSREDVNKYHLWYDKGTGFDPASIEQEITEVKENSTENKLEKNGHGLVDGNIIEYNNSEFFVVNSTVDDFQLSETEDGNPIEIQSDNTVNIVKREVSKESIGIRVDINTNNTRTEILQSTVTKLNEFSDFNIEAYNSVEGAFGKASTNVFTKQNHNLLQGNILSYTNPEGITKLGSVIIISNDQFQLSEINVGSTIEVGTTISQVEEDSAENKLKKDSHGLENGSIVEYNNLEYFVIESTTNDFKLSETENGSPIVISSNNMVDIFINDQSTTLTITNPFIMNVKNLKAGDSTGILSKNQDQVQINNIQNGKSAYINLYSAEDKLHYYIWFDKGSGIDPLIDSSISVRVDISGSGIDPEENVGQYLQIALLDILDFDTLYNKVDTITITNINNGKTTNANTRNLDASLDIGNDWLVSTIAEGKGEDANSNKALWSVSPSLGQAIEETARSFVKIVNRDINSPVNAFYLSGEDDVPGLILLENRNLEDKPFYIGVENTGTIGKDISNEFDPALPFVNSKNTLKLENNISLGFGYFIEINSTTNQINVVDIPGDITNIEFSNKFLSFDELDAFDNLVNRYTLKIDQEISKTYDSFLETSEITLSYTEITPSITGNVTIQTGVDFLQVLNNDDVQIINNELQITSSNHGLATGDEIYFLITANSENDPDQILGNFTVNNVIDANIFTMPVSESLNIKHTKDTLLYFYKTDQVSENEEKPNRIYYSKLLQPEAVPIGNFLDVGSRDFAIERIIALRDTLFVLKTDGVYMLTGFGAPFSVRILDNTSKIIAPDSAVVLNNQIFCLTDDGVASITESGISIISRPIEDKILDVTGQDFDYRLSTFAVPYDNDKAYILWLPVSSGDTVSKQAYRYNYYEKTWTRWTVSATSGVVSNNSILYLGDGERPYTLKERKLRSRLDFSDINFTLQIPPDSVIGENTIRLSNFSEVEIGDVLVQEQYVTIDVYNNLLLKLDLDPLVNKKEPIQLSENSTLVVDNINNTILITEIEGDISSINFLNKKIEFVQIDDINKISYNIKIKEEISKTYSVSENRSEIQLKYESTSNITVNNLSLINEEIEKVVYFNENYETIKTVSGDNISTKLNQLEQRLISDGINISDRTWIPSAQDLETSTFAEYIRDEFNAFIDELNNENSGTQYKTYSKANQLIQYESIVDSKNTTRPDLNRISVLVPHRFFEGDIEVYKAIKTEIQWNPLHFGDPSAQKQFSKGTVIVDQNNFTKATVSYSSDVSQGFVDIEKQGKGVGYFSSGNYGDSNLYWGGDGNDVPLLNIIPREKQRGRYLNVKFQHAVAREGFRILGVTTIVRAVSDRGYR